MSRWIRIGWVLGLAGCAAALEQSPECAAYISCYAKTGGTQSTLDATYGPMGSCWTRTTALATACTDQCKLALPPLKGSFPDAGC
jgi:hypothetical protein